MHYHQGKKGNSRLQGGVELHAKQPSYKWNDLPTSAKWKRYAEYYEKMAKLARTQQKRWRDKEIKNT